MATVDRKALLEAAEKRNKALRDKTPSQVLYMPHDEEHRSRQDFRKRVDYIITANKPPQAFESLKTVLQISRNILRKPEELRFRKFKLNNNKIKSLIVEPKGVLELVVDLGFREKAENFESYYVYSARTHNGLRVGASMIEEILEREMKKYEEEEKRKEREQQEEEELVEKLYNQILDDRKSVATRVQRERETGAYEKGIPARKRGLKKANIVTLHDSSGSSD
ncbi:hypothetical protein BD309DRAFT_947091 [Dichomitus squalens]|uniref:Uncharacterized protein n=1 Tax=Dichomitus squalens TaxID=114155 RepID=A0A4Q9PX64_9APHY|nr:hypothetical protein BD309DRAFT_947091 [Dichomitus squalens]TBU59076.1 hypothetical protein BD310DRAFT_925625 [Dichomitus squalens]